MLLREHADADVTADMSVLLRLDPIEMHHACVHRRAAISACSRRDEQAAAPWQPHFNASVESCTQWRNVRILDNHVVPRVHLLDHRRGCLMLDALASLSEALASSQKVVPCTTSTSFDTQPHTSQTITLTGQRHYRVPPRQLSIDASSAAPRLTL